jgi:hypothetical protein
MKNFGPQKARGAPLLGIGEEREWWDRERLDFGKPRHEINLV